MVSKLAKFKIQIVELRRNGHSARNILAILKLKCADTTLYRYFKHLENLGELA